MTKIQALFCLLRLIVGWLWALVIPFFVIGAIPLVGRERSWTYFAPKWAKLTLAIVGVEIKVLGNFPQQGSHVFACNHQSLLDVVVLPAIVPPTTKFVAKHTLLFVPFWGLAFAMVGAVLVKRKAGLGAERALSRGLKRLPKDWSVVVFPEGTRSSDGQLLPFKRGVLHAARYLKAPIVPIGTHGAMDVMSRHAWLIRPGKIVLTIGEPITWETLQAIPEGERLRVIYDAINNCMRHSEQYSVQAAAVVDHGSGTSPQHFVQPPKHLG